MSFDYDMRAARESSLRGLIWIVVALIIAIVFFTIAAVKAEAKPMRPPMSPGVPLAAAGSPPLQRVLGGRPQSCPVKYCGCALSIDIFGWARRDLFAAAAWYRFMRADPATGHVGIRADGHHVLKLIEPVHGSLWLVFDPNSGGGLTRQHVRDISGLTIVDPRIDTSREARRRARPLVMAADKHGA